MSCWDEYFIYIGAAALASAAAATIIVEAASVAGAPLTVPTAAAAIAAVTGMIAAGIKYIECLENEGNATEAQRLRDELDAREREIQRLRELVGV